MSQFICMHLFQDLFLIFRSSPKSLLCFYESWKSTIWNSGIASHEGLNANANWRKDGNKETSVSLSSLVVQILPLNMQRLFIFKALYTKEETDSFVL